jgi:hypothetical protein
MLPMAACVVSIRFTSIDSVRLVIDRPASSDKAGESPASLAQV